MNEQEALKLALEALELEDMACRYEKDQTPEHITKAITAIREALAQPEQHQDWCASLTQMLASMPPKPAPCNCKPPQPEQEPVAWRYRMPVEDGHWVWNYATYIDDPKDQRCEPLYTTPSQPEPVIDKSAAIRIATSLGWTPQRTWQGLTDEEIDALYEAHHNQYGECETLGFGYERAIEAKLKEKNT